MPILGQIWLLFGQKIQFFTGESKSFGSHKTEKSPRHLVRIEFWSGKGRNGTKMPRFGQKWPKMPNLAVFGPKILILMEGSKSFGTNVPKNHLPPCSHRFLAKNISIGPNLAVFGPKKQFWGGWSKTFGNQRWPKGFQTRLLSYRWAGEDVWSSWASSGRRDWITLKKR